jgi:hypothetical protein
VFRDNGTYPVGSPSPYLEWAVMRDPFGNSFCLIKDLPSLGAEADSEP